MTSLLLYAHADCLSRQSARWHSAEHSIAIIPDSAVRITEHIDTDLPFSPHLASVISLAPAAAAGKGSRTVDSEHLLQALLDEEENLILRGLDHLGLTRTSIQKTLDLVVPDGTPLDDNDVTFGPEARAILEAAVTDAQLVGNSIVNGANLVWALANGTTGYAAGSLGSARFLPSNHPSSLGVDRGRRCTRQSVRTGRASRNPHGIGKDHRPTRTPRGLPLTVV